MMVHGSVSQVSKDTHILNAAYRLPGAIVSDNQSQWGMELDGFAAGIVE